MVGGGGGIVGNDVNSDNLVFVVVNLCLMGLILLSNVVVLDNYIYICNINFLINNVGDCLEKGSVEYNYLMGEVYYFCVWFYYFMFLDYGWLVWVDILLELNLEVMMLFCESCIFIVDKILVDLDMVILLMKEQNNLLFMCLYKDVVCVLKSEVVFFEVIWEKWYYVKEKNKFEKFYDMEFGEVELMVKIDNYLDQFIVVVEEVC